MPVFVCNAVLADELWDPLAILDTILDYSIKQPKMAYSYNTIMLLWHRESYRELDRELVKEREILIEQERFIES